MTQVSKPRPRNQIPLIIVAVLFSLLLAIFLFLLNLKFLFKPRFIQARLREAGIYEAVSDQVGNVWRNLGGYSGQGIAEWPQPTLEPEWLQQETERNLEALGRYLSGEETELALNVNLEPVKKQIAEQMVTEPGTARQLEEEIPDRIDILGKDGLVSEQAMRQLYQLRVAIEGLTLSLKILAFLLILSLLTFFLLLPQQLAWRWVGTALLFSGATLFGVTLLLRILAVTYLKPYLGERLHFAPILVEESTTLIDRFLQTYLSLIQWQSAAVFLSGSLILLLATLSHKKDEG